MEDVKVPGSVMAMFRWISIRLSKHLHNQYDPDASQFSIPGEHCVVHLPREATLGQVLRVYGMCVTAFPEYTPTLAQPADTGFQYEILFRVGDS